LQASLGGLFAVAENYPDLKADQTFLNLQGRITGLENQIADRREFYNDAVAINNVRIQQFPDMIVAGVFNFGSADMLRFASKELEDVDVAGRFKA
jgi:LemA protein